MLDYPRAYPLPANETAGDPLLNGCSKWELQAFGFSFKTRGSDTETYLRLYKPPLRPGNYRSRCVFEKAPDTNEGFPALLMLKNPVKPYTETTKSGFRMPMVVLPRMIYYHITPRDMYCIWPQAHPRFGEGGLDESQEHFLWTHKIAMTEVGPERLNLFGAQTGTPIARKHRPTVPSQ